VDVSGLASGVAAISAGGGHTCALTSAGAVQVLGLQRRRRLGDGTTTDATRRLTSPGWRAAWPRFAGRADTCALTSAGGGQVLGLQRQTVRLGDGTTTDRHTPVDVSGLASGVAAIAAGDDHTCALTSAGGVECWGRQRRRPARRRDGDDPPHAGRGDRLRGALKCDVPNVIGKPLAKARTKIRRAHCRLGTVTRVVSQRKEEHRRRPKAAAG
jgi:alpha-tubulin suppressor-like RCC1 family protein